MPAVTRGAASRRAVGIDAPDSTVRPCARVELAIAFISYDRAMTLHAAVHRGRPAFDDFSEDVVERAYEACRLRVMRCFKLCNLFLVASVAVVRRDDDRDLVSVVIEGRGVAFVGFVTRIAVNTDSKMRAVFPLINRAGRGVLVTLQTLLAFGGNRPQFLRLRIAEPAGGERDQQRCARQDKNRSLRSPLVVHRCLIPCKGVPPWAPLFD